MTDQPNCAYTDDADIEQRYLAGKLSEADAEEFERHYFDCDACWNRVQRGAEIRAALQPAAESAQPVKRETLRQPPVRRRSFGSWVTPLAAAAVVLVGVGLWRNRSNGPTESQSAPNAPTVEPTRGASTSLLVSSHATSDGLVAAWTKAANAQTYRVRLLAADGSLLFERETADTSVVLPSDSARVSASSGSRFWQIQALDELRKIVATSQLTPVKSPRDSL
jgi:hypothetical protein